MLRDNDNSAEAQASFWAKNPLVAPAIALCAGIFFGRYSRLDLTATLVIAGLLVLAAIAARAFPFRRSSVVLLVAIAALGLARYHVSLIPLCDPLSPGTAKGLLRGVVCDQPQVFQQQNRTRVVLNDCIFKGEDGGTERLPYRVMLSISADAGNLWPMSSLKFDESDPRRYMKPSRYSIEPKRDLNYGDTLEARVRLSRPQPMRNPGGFDAREYYAQRGIVRSAYCSTESTASVIQAHDQGLYSNAVNLLWSWRRDFRSLIEDTCDWQHVPMTKALILGDRTGITTDHYDQLQRIGVAHIIAISGLHVGFVAFFFLWFFKRVFLSMGLFVRGTLGLRLTCLTASIPVLAYLIIASPRHATLRATIIVLCWLFAKAIDRDHLILNFLALAAIIILAGMPGALFEAGFQLSFVAAAAVVIAFWATFSKLPVWINEAAPTLPARVREILRSFGLELPFSRGFPQATVAHARLRSHLDHVSGPAKYIMTLMIASLAATVCTAPLVAWWFGRISIIGVFANLWIVPAAFVLVSLLLPAFVASIVSETLARTLLAGADRATWLMQAANDWFSKGSLPTRLLASTPCIIAYAVFMLFLLCLWFLIVRPTRTKVITTAVAILCSFLAFTALALTYVYCSVPRPSLATCAAYYATLILACFLIQRPSPRRVVATSLAAFILISSVFVGARRSSDLLRVAFLDVGRGFSCVIEAPGGKVAVIDGGGSIHGASEVGRNVLLPYLRCRGIARIDYVILSNPHSERIDGLFSLLSEAGSDALGHVEIGEVVLRDFDCQSRKYQKFRSAIRQLGLPVTGIGNLTGLKLQSLAENSLVARLAFGEFSILFLSDAGCVSQLLLSEYRDALKSTILVAPQGFETSVSSDFMSLVAPQAVIASGADLRWRKPKPPPLQSETPGRRILGTKELHCIVVESNGREWRALTPFAEQDDAAVEQGRTGG